MPECFVEKAMKIQHQHINDALEYIAENNQGVRNPAGIYYILNTRNLVSWGVWHGRTQKWFGVKETMRVTYLFAIRKSPPFTGDEILNELGPRSPRGDSDPCERWKTGEAEAILKKHGFLCEKRGSGSSEEEDE